MFASEVEGGSNIVSMVAFALFKAAAAIGIIYFIGRRIIRPLFQYVGCERSTEWFMPLILLVIVGAAAITYASGLSLALGAFLAGLLINETEYRHEVELVVEPLKGIFMGIFFLSVGMMIDVREIARVPFWVFFSVLGIFTIKGTVIFILGVLAKMPASRAIHVALLLGQSGEFAFLIVGLSMQHGLLNAEGGQFFLIVTAISMFITPFVAYGAGKLARWLEQKEDCNSTWVSEHGSGHEKGHVIIVGFGRVGKKVGDILEEEKIPYVAIDKSSGHLSRLRNQGYPLYFGDARKFHLLKRLNAEDARAIVITSDDFASTQTILENVRRIAPLLPTIVRARDDVHVQQLFAAGANFVIPEALETSLQIAKDVLSEIGIDPSEIRDVLEKSRKVEEVG
jgi:CPA2 family monovalent cation:H+ antiporter-2